MVHTYEDYQNYQNKCKKLTLKESGLSIKYYNLLRSLNSAVKIQNFLDKIQMNFEQKGETYMSPMRVLALKKAHCLEGALVAAAALWIQGKTPLLLDLKSGTGDDHICCLYQENGFWGAISKTNHATLRFRDPVYSTLRELAMSYFHEYFDLKNGEKILRSYSEPFDMRKWGTHSYKPGLNPYMNNQNPSGSEVSQSLECRKSEFKKIEKSFHSNKYFDESREGEYQKNSSKDRSRDTSKDSQKNGSHVGPKDGPLHIKPYGWITTQDEMQDLAEAIDLSKHFEIVPKKNIKFLRNADKMERKGSSFVEWEV